MIPIEVADITDMLVEAYEIEERIASRIAWDIYREYIQPDVLHHRL